MSSKIKDGLFLGDIDAAQDADFLQLNGIVHIINCAPRQVPNLFQQSLDLSYVTCDLDDMLRLPFFDLKNREFMGIVHLIDRSLDRTESVLVHSVHGLNRSPSVIIGYLMVKYCWGVDKAFEFLMTKRSDIKPHESYIDQLCVLESQIQIQHDNRISEQQVYEWHPGLADPLGDEIVLVHTFLNCSAKQSPSVDDSYGKVKKASHNRRLSWIDQDIQMKKLYPSLLLKPERPPNHSYVNMTPGNGWVDLVTPATAPKTAFMERPSKLTHNLMTVCSESTGMLEDNDKPIVKRTHRVNSFSFPKQRDNNAKIDQLSATMMSISSFSTTKEQLDSLESPMEIECEEIKQRGAVCESSMSTRSQYASTGPIHYRTATAAPTILLGTTVPNTTCKGQCGRKTEPTKEQNKPTTKRTPISNSGIALTPDFPPPRRAFADVDSSKGGGKKSQVSRPKSAPPRLRKKEIELNDLPIHRKSELSITGNITRMTLEIPAKSSSAHLAASSRRRMSAMPASEYPIDFNYRNGKAPEHTSSIPSSKSAKAHWK